MSLRLRAIRFLEGAGVVDAALRARARVRAPWLTVLCYHRTAERVAADGVDDEVVDATPAQFDEQLGFLARHFRFVSLDEVVAARSGAPLPPNPVLVTFDDGYKDCLTTSLPVLVRHGAPAAFFIPTTFVDERRMFWWDRIAWILGRARTERFELRYPVALTIDVKGGTSEAHLTLTELLKTTHGVDFERFFEGLEAAAGVALSRDEERRLVDRALMTWDEIRKLADAGMAIGSHTRSHRVLQTLDEAELADELAGSRRELTERLDRRVDTIAYPVGYSIKGHGAIERAVRDAGYALGFSCRAGVSSPRGDALDVPRFLMDRSYDAQLFAGLTALPPLAPRTLIDVA